MSDDPKSNIFNLLQSYFRIYDAALNVVGCGTAPWDLAEFEPSPFKKLIGLDNDTDIAIKAFNF